MRLLSALLVAPVWLAAQSAPSAPADTTDKKAAAPPPPAPTVNHLETTLAGFKLSGFAEASYAYSGRSLGDTAQVAGPKRHRDDPPAPRGDARSRYHTE